MKRSRFFLKPVFSSCGMLASMLGSLAIALSLCTTGGAATLQLYSFETGLEGWSAANATVTADGLLGVTDGSQALHINGLTSGFKNDVGFSGNIVSGPAFDALNDAAAAIAGGATDVTLEFDLGKDTSGVTVNQYVQLGIFVNSTGVGFKQYGTGSFIGGNATTSFPNLYATASSQGATISNTGAGQYHVSVPLGPSVALNIGVGTFFQIGFKSNGGWTGTMDLGIDNITVSGSTVGIPEPGSMALVGIAGLFSVGTVRRRRRA
ncbi:MAG: PEP-CTERM sorting domain-containing protein [Planctomycetales bacterium]|nr:PEP-CTERM sorting domain-containing protein [Planctomycetales bacterium]